MSGYACAASPTCETPRSDTGEILRGIASPSATVATVRGFRIPGASKTYPAVTLCVGRDVRVESEEVGRVIFGFERDEPLPLFRAVGGLDAVIGVVAREVHVHALAKGLKGVEHPPNPGDMPIGLSVVRQPGADDVDVVCGITVREGGCVRGDTRDGAALREERDAR